MEKDVVIVTGGTKGLGLAIVNRLLEANYFVVAIGRTLTEGVEINKIKHANSFLFEQFDLTNLIGIHDLIKGITQKTSSIYGLVNNAAIGLDGVLATMHESEIDNAIKLNIQSPILMTKYAMRPMLLKRRGRIINISSIIANTGFSGLSVYGATKGALSSFTRSLAREAGKYQITVNTIAPGYMKTEMTAGLTGGKLDSIIRRCALGYLPDVLDVAKTVEFLMGENAAAITGTTITVDAGSTA